MRLSDFGPGGGASANGVTSSVEPPESPYHADCSRPVLCPEIHADIAHVRPHCVALNVPAFGHVVIRQAFGDTLEYAQFLGRQTFGRC